MDRGKCCHFPSVKRRGESKEGKVGEERGDEGWETILGGSVATRQRVYHNSCCPQGKLGRLHQKAHSQPTSNIWHTHNPAHTLTLLSVNTQEKLIPYNRLIPRLMDVISQSLLPKLLALGSEVCFYNCSGFHLNELKFHLSGAPCPCQHILQMESWAGLTSTHLPPRLLLIPSSFSFLFFLQSPPQDREGDRRIKD